MHQGTFPSPYQDGSPDTRDGYRRGGWSAGDLEETPRGLSSRRQWLAALGGACLGITGVIGWGQLGATSPPAPAAAPNRRNTPEWALSMLDAPPEELIRWSGDLDRVCARHPGDERLVACFDRLLDAVLDVGPGAGDREMVDVAGAAAVRSLKRLRRTDLVVARSRRIMGQRDLIETRAATERILDAERSAREAGR